MEKMIKTIVISAREVKTDDKKFISCSAKIGGEFYKIKFKQECEISPKKVGLYDLTIDVDNCSIQNGKKYVTNDGYDAIGNKTIWISKVENLRKYTDEEMNEINRAKFESVFAEG